MNIRLTKDIKEANCITHSGTFHTDEIFSTIILSEIMEQIILIRVLEIEKEYEDKIIYDIGGKELDHHQLGGNGQRENGVKYASCGLVWKKYGREVLKKYNVINIDEIFKAIDKDIIQYIDAVDNGQTPNFSTDYKYVNLSTIISSFNPFWNENVDSDSNFYEALKLANVVWKRMLNSIISKYKAKDIVENAINSSREKIMILDKFVPWKEFVIDSDNDKAKDIYFVIIPSNRGGYAIYTVPKEKGSFESRKLFPKEWGGLRDDELQKVTGIKSARFCHNARFLCTTETKEDAIQIAIIAKDYNEKE